jgi:zinc finger FYVE domain-containing protein 26
MDKETEILSRLAANHLHLAQFEPLRAVLLALRSRNPELALAVLQTIVARSGRFQNILWSTSCPSPPLLTYLSTLELLQFDNNATSAWSFDPETLRLRAEFLLLVQHLIDRVSESLRKNFDLESLEKVKEKDGSSESESYDERAEVLEKGEELRDSNGEFDDCVRILDRILELGVKRLKPDVDVDDGDGNGNGISSGAASIEEGELVCLRKVALDYADVFDALCWNIQRQVRGWEGYDLGLSINENARREDLSEEEGEDLRVLGLIQRSVQLAHLDAIKECLKEGDVEGAIPRIRFLHIDYGGEETEYRYVCFKFLFIFLLFT